MNNIDVSVVIPVKNGQRYLDSVLRAVFSQKINAKFEVIIIDSGSGDKTLDIIKQYPVRLYQIDEKKFNHGLTRNLGISKAQAKFVILTTADAIPCNNHWMEELIDDIKNDECVAGIYSRQIPHKDSHVITQIRVSRFFTSYRKRRESQMNRIEDYNKLSPREKHRFCNFDNVSSFIRKSVWAKIPLPKTDFSEDLEWSKKVLEAGYKIVYKPDSIVYHSHDFSILDWYNKNRVNSKKLCALFGVNTIDNIYKILKFFLIRTLRDIYLLFIDKRQFKIVVSNIYLIPIFSLSGILGQYRGIRDCKHS